MRAFVIIVFFCVLDFQGINNLGCWCSSCSKIFRVNTICCGAEIFGFWGELSGHVNVVSSPFKPAGRWARCSTFCGSHETSSCLGFRTSRERSLCVCGGPELL